MIDTYDYSRWPNFSREKLICQVSGLHNPNEAQFIELMDAIQALRNWYGRPMYVNSCYRHPTLHPLESKKVKPGQHSVAAIDFRVPSEHTHIIVKKMFEMNFTGIGINLTGPHGRRFIHGDFRDAPAALWSY